MTAKWFPIKTETACQLKWAWSTVRLYSGTTSSCHRVQPDSIDADNFANFHNTPKKLRDRALMLNGEWPQGGCEYCKHIEDAGGFSDRKLHLNIPDQTPVELETNPVAINVTPKILEVYFDNVCNMSCLYCWDGFSSKIQQENAKHGRFEKHGVVIDNIATRADTTALTSSMWLWMERNHHHLARFNVLGGEPFYQKQFEQCLDFFEHHPSPNLEFNVVSNLMISSDKLRTIIDKIQNLVTSQKIKRFDLTASIDCFGAEQEYVRYGLDLEQWKTNFEFLVNQPWIVLNINQTLSGLTIKTIPEMLTYVNQVKGTRPVGHYFSTVVMTHEFMHPGIFGHGFFDKDFTEILECIPESTARQYMQGIQMQINAEPRDQNKINQLGIFLDEMDRRRNTNWREVFPWLTKELDCVV